MPRPDSVVETDDVRAAVDAAQRHLLSLQHEDGHWCGELEGDTILESEYILVMHYMGRTDDPKVHKAASFIRGKQQVDGGWATYPGGPADVSVSTKAYFVLKLLGDSPDSPHMLRARDRIRELGGLDACNSFTKIYLAIFGQYDWDRCPTVPPELILLPPWFYFNIYEMSSWSRAIVVPLSIISAKRPYCPVPDSAGIGELRVPGRSSRPGSLWGAMFHGLDAALKILERFPIQVPREIAIQRCEQWTLDRLADSDGLGAIFPPIVNTIYALHALGYSFEHPAVKGQVRELERLEIEEDDTLRVQPCFGPVWDTALSVNALIESGLAPDHEALLRAGRWMMDKRGHEQGDWRIKNRRTRKAGWFFEYANPYYPDCDTTSKVITALSKVRWPDAREASECATALGEAQRWHQTMQNRDGGWGAFDRGCDKEILTHVPFADHNAMIDPSTADLTARALEMMSAVGLRRELPAVQRAIAYLTKEQESDGSWFGRWGVNYLYGTWLALWGLMKIGEPTERSSWARRAAHWLRRTQNEDGGWGETPASYANPKLKAVGESTASQTAWAVLGLIAAGEVGSRAVRRGVRFLLDRQREDGGWSEQPWTGTGFPRVFYLKYHMYPIYFPLLALGVYLARLEDGDHPQTEPVVDDTDGEWKEAGAIAS
jgi:squalene-hopene/tetraprenyl-beta-curcumene cyclase